MYFTIEIDACKTYTFVFRLHFSTISINICSKHNIKVNYKISEKMQKIPFSKANPVNPLNDLK